MNDITIYSKSMNSLELLRSLSLKGINSFNTRIFSFNDLLEEVNVKLGFKVNNHVLSQDEIEKKAIDFFLKNVKLNNPSYLDIKHFLQTFFSIRDNIGSSNEKEAIFKVISNHEDMKCLSNLKEFIDAYYDSLGTDIDKYIYCHRLMDECSSPVFSEIFIFEEFELTPLEEAFLHKIANKVSKTSILSLFEHEVENNKIKQIEPRYGIRNEVAHVIKDIDKNHYKQDECEIVLLDKNLYTNELYKAMLRYNLKMTFECGLPINLTNAYKLYKSLVNLDKKYFFDVNGYLNIFSSDALDIEKLKVKHPNLTAELLGRMKICFDKKVNDDYLAKFNNVKNNHKEEFELFISKINRDINKNKDVFTEVEHVIEEFSKGISYIIRNYTNMNDVNKEINQQAIDYICTRIDFSLSQDFDPIFKESYLSVIDSKYLGQEIFNDEAIHVTTLDKALSVVRKNVFILGLNASVFPGSMTEDFLFPDYLYEELSKTPHITLKHLNNKNDYLTKLINTFLKLGSNLYLSYCAQEIKEVRPLNPCSVLLNFAEDLFKDENKRRRLENPDYKDVLTEKISKCSYYDDELGNISEISNIAINNQSIIDDSTLSIPQEQDDKRDDYLNAFYSPSTISKFLDCPLRFYIENMLKVRSPNEYDALNPIDGSRFGDLFHFVMEKFVNSGGTFKKDVLKKKGEEVFDLYTSIDRSIANDDLEKNDFLKSIENTYNFLQQFDLSNSECELNVNGDIIIEEEGSDEKLTFGGSIDLVTKNENGETVIIDYKTGRTIKHKQNDVKSCIQGLIYAQLYKKIYKEDVRQVIFYYTRLDQSIAFDDPCGKDATKDLKQEIKKLYDAINSLTFDIPTKKEQEHACKYCKFERICRKKEKNTVCQTDPNDKTLSNI